MILRNFFCVFIFAYDLGSLSILGDLIIYASLPMGEVPDLAKLSGNTYNNNATAASKLKNAPVLYSGTFTLDKTGDAFIDMETWGKGILFINGVNLVVVCR